MIFFSFQERSVIILLTIINVLFFICNFPQAILRIMHSLDGHHYKYNVGFQIFRIICNLLEFSNASLNFYIYFLCNRQVREHVNYLLKYCKKKLVKTERVFWWRHKSYVTKTKETAFQCILENETTLAFSASEEFFCKVYN